MRSASNSCIISCLTNSVANLSTCVAPTASATARAEPVLEDNRSILGEFSAANPDVLIFVSPPIYRQQPEWYRHELAKVLVQFSKFLSSLLGTSFHVLPRFPFPELESDGVHLTPNAGLKFVVQLFDSSLDLINTSVVQLPVGVNKCAEKCQLGLARRGL